MLIAIPFGFLPRGKKYIWHKTSFEVRKKGFIEKHFFILSIFKVINHEHKNSVMPDLTEKLIKQG